MTEPNKHYYQVPPNIKEMTEEERKAFVRDIWLKMTITLKKDKEKGEKI